MHRDYTNYSGLWHMFPQTVEELVNYLELGTKIYIHYDNLTCPNTSIRSNQLGMLYNNKLHAKLQVSYYKISFTDNKHGLVITVKDELKNIPKYLIEHSNRKPIENIDSLEEYENTLFDY